MRKAVLDAEPLCRHCSEEGRITPAVEVDHINGRADRAQDYERSNLQPLCRAHHSIKTALENGSFGRGRGKAARRGCDANGIPLDANHHWRRP